MGDKSKIEWTDATWNPVRGCSVVSEGCRNCYAMSVAARFSGPGLPYEDLAYRNGSGAHWTGKVQLVEGHLEDPLRWKTARRVFVNSMSDLFHESIPNEWIAQIFSVMQKSPRHTFQVLTKRPRRMVEYLRWHIEEAPYLGEEARDWRPLFNGFLGKSAESKHRAFAAIYPNVWLGASVEDQKTADERIPLLMETPAAVRWISAEPLLGPIDIESVPTMEGSIDWVVCGGESGPKARPMHPDWARSLRDQCFAARVPFFFKQWGEWVDYTNVGGNTWTFTTEVSGTRYGRISKGKEDLFDGRAFETRYPYPAMEDRSVGPCMVRVGKKAAGRLLDGREWNEYPVANSAAACRASAT